MSTARLIQGRIERFCEHYHGAPFHAVLCDPPYHLTSITKRFGGKNAAPAQYGKDGAFARASRGFMNSTWDGGDIAFQPDTWSAIASLLYPGAFIMAFAGARTYHRMAVAMEDAGLILNTPIGWLFNSGFPKSTRIDTQLDVAAGVEREVKLVPTKAGNLPEQAGDIALGANGFRDVSEPVTLLAQTWAGHRYGGQVLKPAFEFIAVAQVPYPRGMRKADSIAATGAGAINIEAGRIPGDNPIASHRNTPQNEVYGKFNEAYTPGDSGKYTQDLGRWPANFTLDTEAGEWLDERTGELDPGGGQPGQGDGQSKGIFGMGSTVQVVYDTPGGASKFYHTYDWQSEISERLENADPIKYQPKASSSEREAGLRHHTPQTVNDGRDTPIDNPYQRGETLRKNIHPTQKPIGLTEWLAKLLLPPRAYAPRRLLVPFAGTGSEMIGAYRAGWDYIVGVEMTPEYVDIGKARLDYWLRQGIQLDMFEDR